MAPIRMPEHKLAVVHASERLPTPSGKKHTEHVLGFVDQNGNDTGHFIRGTRVSDITHLNFLPLLGSRHGTNRDVVSVKSGDGRLVYKFPKSIRQHCSMPTVDEERYPILEESIPCAKGFEPVIIPNVRYTDLEGNDYDVGMRVVVEEDVGRKNLAEEKFNIHVSRGGMARLKKALADIAHNSIIMLQRGYLIDIKPENFVLRERGPKKNDLVLVDKDSLAEVDDENKRERLDQLGENLGKTLADLFMLNDPLLDASRYSELKKYLEEEIRLWKIVPKPDRRGEEVPELTPKEVSVLLNGMQEYLKKKFNQVPADSKLDFAPQAPPLKSLASGGYFGFTNESGSPVLAKLETIYRRKISNLEQLDKHVSGLESELERAAKSKMISVARRNQVNRSLHIHKLAALEAQIRTYEKIAHSLGATKVKKPGAAKDVKKNLSRLKKLLVGVRKEQKKLQESLEGEELDVGTRDSIDIHRYGIPAMHNAILQALDAYKTTMAGKITEHGNNLSEALETAEEEGQLPPGTAARLGIPLATQNQSLLENELDIYQHTLGQLRQQKRDLQKRRKEGFITQLVTGRTEELFDTLSRHKTQNIKDYLEKDPLGKQISILTRNKDLRSFQGLLGNMSEEELNDLSAAVSNLPRQVEDELDLHIGKCESKISDLRERITPVKALTDKYYQ